MNNNKVIITPDLIDVLKEHKRDIMISLNCHAIATVQSFDAGKQTCTATINYGKTIYENGLPIVKDYPILLDVPVIVMNGGVSGITFPISKGDTCLILFNDRDMDNWFSGNTSGPVATPRLHSMADGLCLVGVRSLNNPIHSYDSVNSVWYHNQTKITVGDKVKIEVNGVSLMTALNQLMTAIKVPALVAGVPVNNSAQVAAIDAAKIVLESILLT